MKKGEQIYRGFVLTQHHFRLDETVLKILRDVFREGFVSETPYTKCGVLTKLLYRYGKRNQREIGEFMGIHDSAVSVARKRLISV